MSDRDPKAFFPGGGQPDPSPLRWIVLDPKWRVSMLMIDGHKFTLLTLDTGNGPPCNILLPKDEATKLGFHLQDVSSKC